MTFVLSIQTIIRLILYCCKMGVILAVMYYFMVYDTDTEGPLLTRFFEILEKQLCEQKTV